jgi:hypothetical protein
MQWINSLRNGMLRNCAFGTYRAPTTNICFCFNIFREPATIRIAVKNSLMLESDIHGCIVGEIWAAGNTSLPVPGRMDALLHFEEIRMTTR